MSLSKLQTSFRAKLNSSSQEDSSRGTRDYSTDLLQIQQNFDDVKTPKLYQKIVNHFKAIPKNKKIMDIMEDRSYQNKFGTFGSNDTKNILRESTRDLNIIEDPNQELIQKFKPKNNKENLSEYNSSRNHLKHILETSTQTSPPKPDGRIEEVSKLKDEYSMTKKQLTILEDDLSKIRVENIKLEKALKTAQDNLAVLGKNQNNTSSSFSLPSEFKANWETLTKEQIINVYTDFIGNPIIVTNLVQDIIMICYDSVKNLIKETNKGILKLLNLNDKNESMISKHLTNFYQDNYSTIFKLDEEKLNKIKDQYRKSAKKIFTFEYTNELTNSQNDYGDDPSESDSNIENENKFTVPIDEDFESYFDQLLENEDFGKFLQSLFSLCIYMLLNDPPLIVPLEGFKNRKYIYRKFKKNEYICVDGFSKEGSPSIVLVPPVSRNNYAYHGIKPAVIILQEDFVTQKMKNLMDAFEEEEKAKLSKKLEKENELNNQNQSSNQSPPKSSTPINTPLTISELLLPVPSSNSLVTADETPTNTTSTIIEPQIAEQSLDFTLSRPVGGNQPMSSSQINEMFRPTIEPLESSRILSNMHNYSTTPPKITKEDMVDAIKERFQGYPQTEKKPKKSSTARPQYTPQYKSNISPTKTTRNDRRASIEEIIKKYRDTTTGRSSPANSSSRQRISTATAEEHHVIKLKDRISSLFGDKRKERKSAKNQITDRSDISKPDLSTSSKFNSFMDSSYNSKKKNQSSFTELMLKEWEEARIRPSEKSVHIEENWSLFHKIQQKHKDYRKTHEVSLTSSVHVPRDRTEHQRNSDIKDKIRKSFMEAKQSFQESLDGTNSVANSSRSKNNTSCVLPPKYKEPHGDFNSSVTSLNLKQSIELLKNAKAHNDKMRMKGNPNSELNSSMAGRIINQSFKLDQNNFSTFDAETEEDENKYRSSSIVRMITQEKRRNVDRIMFEDSSDLSMNFKKALMKKDREPENCPQPLTQDLIKQRLTKLNSNLRSISTNRRSYIPKNEHELMSSVHASHQKDGYLSSLNRIGSVNKLTNTDRSGKDANDPKILNILKSIYSKN